MRSDRGLTESARREGVWPRIYRPTRGYRLLLGGLGWLVTAGALALTVLVLRDPTAPPLAALAIGGILTLLGVSLLAMVVRERLRADPAFGADPAEREEALSRTKLLARTPAVATFAAVAWGWFRPRPYAAVVASLAWGTVAEANVLLDARPPERHRVRVTEKRVSSGKVTTWKVRLAPFGAVSSAEEADVSRAEHDAIAVGDEACVALHAGRLGARWLTVRRCE